MSRATISRGYGSQIIRFSSVTVISSVTVRSTGDDENGFLAATFEKGANSSAMSRRYSSTLRPSQARRALSSSPYCTGAPVNPCVAVYSLMYCS